MKGTRIPCSRKVNSAQDLLPPPLFSCRVFKMEEETSAKEKSFAWAQAEGAQKSESRGNYGRVGVAKSAGLTVRLKGKRNSLSLSLSLSLTHSLSLSLSLSLSHSLTHSLTHSLSFSLTHSLTHSLSFSHLLSLSLFLSLTLSFSLSLSLSHSSFEKPEEVGERLKKTVCRVFLRKCNRIPVPGSASKQKKQASLPELFSFSSRREKEKREKKGREKVESTVVSYREKKSKVK